MKKSRKIFGAVALSAVLAFGTAVPAFAAGPNDDLANGGVVNADQTSNTATTNVNIATYSSNYSVTVPLMMPFVLDQMGGSANNLVPTNYYIQNNGAAAVQIDKVAWDLNTAANTITANNAYYYTFGKTFDDTSVLGSGDNYDSTWHAVGFKTGGSWKRPTYGSFIIQMTPDVAAADPSATATGTVVETKSQIQGADYDAIDGKAKVGSTDDMAEGTYTPWKFNSKTVDVRTANTNTTNSFEAGKYYIGLKIWNTQLNQAAEKALTAVANITYTVAPATV